VRVEEDVVGLSCSNRARKGNSYAVTRMLKKMREGEKEREKETTVEINKKKKRRDANGKKEKRKKREGERGSRNIFYVQKWADQLVQLDVKMWQ
jgi:hypothetical protein